MKEKIIKENTQHFHFVNCTGAFEDLIFHCFNYVYVSVWGGMCT